MDPSQPDASSMDDLFELAPCALVTTHINGLITRANVTFCHWVGLPVSAIVGQRTLQDFFTRGARMFHLTHWGPMLAVQLSVSEVKVDLSLPNGTTMPILLNAARRFVNEVACDHYAFFIVNDRHKYEQELIVAKQRAEIALEAKRLAQMELEAADMRKDVFLATLAHELRNPLAPMRNVVEVLRTGNARAERFPWCLSVLDRQLFQLSRLVDDLLDIARITNGKIVIRKERVDIRSVIRNAVTNIAPTAQAKQQVLTLTYPEEAVFLQADPVRLAQVLGNLLNNAVKYTGSGGTISLTAAPSGDTVVITVSDTGIGIPPDKIDVIFQMFSQLPAGNNYSQGGLGIGLSLAQSLTALHEGTLTAESEGEGRGTTFTLTLPTDADQSEASVTVSRASQEALAPSRILVVDDNQDAALTLSEVLKADGHTVQTVFSGREAMDAIQATAPAVVILDIGLPDLSGYDVATWCRSAGAFGSTLLVALTGWGQEADRRNATAAGFDLHFTKPVDLTELKQAIGKAMRHSAMRPPPPSSNDADFTPVP